MIIGRRRQHQVWIKYIDIAAFFVNNYSNNLIFNNKSDKIEMLRIQMTARHCQWRLASFSFFIFYLLRVAQRQWEKRHSQ
jgi:hypothetical protein